MTSSKCRRAVSYFYPRPPRGGRLMHFLIWRTFMLFLSTPSARRATVAAETPKPAKKISIHALREEGDRFDNYLE